MSKKHTAGLLALGVFALSCGGGCASMSNTAKGAGIGGLLGAGAGAAIGSLTGNAGTGAAIGAGAGALLGGVAGNDVDMQEKREGEVKLAHAQAEAAAASARPPLTITQVAEMVRDGVSDRVIIDNIRATGTTYTLTADHIRYLNSQNVSDDIIIELQRPKQRVAAGSAPPVIVQQRPVIVEEPVYIMQPQPVRYTGVMYQGGMHRR